MADNILYYDNDAANRSTEIDRNGTIASSNSVMSGYIFQDAITREPLVGTMPENGSVRIILEPSEDGRESYYIIPEGHHDGTGIVIAPSISEYTYGTAKAEDIAAGKVAWVNGEKIVGTLDVDSSEQNANATADDIMSGKSAWVRREKIIGTIPYLYRIDKTLLPGEEYIIPYGLSSGESVITAADLSSQTVGDAEAKDIALGKTVWVNGEKIVGTFKTEDAVREWLSEATTQKEYVLEGKKFYSTLYNTVVEGTMIDHSGEETRILTNDDIFYIPAGYYNGLTAIQVAGIANVTVANMEPNDLIEGKTAWVNGEKITGTMPKIENLNEIVACDEIYNIPEGYHSGNGIVKGKDLASQTVADAKSIDIFEGKTAWVNGVKLTGTMPLRQTVEILLQPGESYSVLSGYHTGNDRIWTKSIEEQTIGTATANDLLEGSTAWVNGTEIAGTIPVIDHQDISLNGGDSYTIPKGYHDGTGTVIAAGTDVQTPGTATADDIIKDKTAWVDGVKLTGNIELTGTAISVQVLKGKTFYNSNVHQQITGELELTGDATADKVLRGYKFYSDDPFTKLEGTLELTGNAKTAHVLEGETFYTTYPDFKETGTMINRGAITRRLNSGEVYTIPVGYHNGSGKITAPSIESVTEGTATVSDILSPKTAWVDGQKLTGTLELTGNAYPEHVVSGKTFYNTNAKSKQTGTMPTITDSDTVLYANESFILRTGYHDTQVTISSADLSDQTSGTATATDMLEGSTAWVNGEKVVGTIPIVEPESQTISAGESYTIPIGYHDGSEVITSESLNEQTIGTATEDNIIEGSTAWVNGIELTGTMPNIGTVDISLNGGDSYTIPKGYHDGTGTVIAAGTDVQTPGTATADDIIKDKTAWVDGVKLTGTIPIINPIYEELLAGESFTISAGYHDGTGVIIATNLSDQTSATAESSDILINKTAWVNGEKITGTIPNIGSENDTINCGSIHTISEGYHDGTGKIIAATLASQTSATAESSDILINKTAWVNGIKLTGIIPNIGSESEELLAGSTHTISEGYHDGTGVITAATLASQTPGNAVINNILINKTAWVNGTKITGTMPDIGSENDTINCGSIHTISEGYHDGTGKIIAATLASQTPGNAISDNILINKTAWVNGIELTGTMPNIGTVDISLDGGESYIIPKGYHDGTGTVTSTSVQDLTPGDATANDILENKIAWANGVKLIGTIPIRTGNNVTINAGDSVTVPAGYYPNGFVIKAATLESQTDSTAVPGDIVVDKTAWVKGEKITGIINDGNEVAY